jgi:hypothetical protein
MLSLNKVLGYPGETVVFRRVWTHDVLQFYHLSTKMLLPETGDNRCIDYLCSSKYCNWGAYREQK